MIVYRISYVVYREEEERRSEKRKAQNKICISYLVNRIS